MINKKDLVAKIDGRFNTIVQEELKVIETALNMHYKGSELSLHVKNDRELNTAIKKRVIELAFRDGWTVYYKDGHGDPRESWPGSWVVS